MIRFRIHSKIETSDNFVMFQGLMYFQSTLKYFDVFLDEKISQIVPGKFDMGRITDFSYYPVELTGDRSIYFVIRQESMKPANADEPPDVLVIEARTEKDRKQLRLAYSGTTIMSLAGPGQILDMSSELPQKIDDNTLEERKKIASETYYSDEAFLDAFQEKSEDLGMEEDTAMAIYAEGENMAFEVAEDSIFLSEDAFLAFLQNEIREVREVIMVMLEQAAS